jgi:choline kinase
MGTRLGPLSVARPKALVEVAGRTLLDHAIDFARLCAPDAIVVVGGREFAAVAAVATRAGALAVENQRFHGGNLLSLLAARPHLDEDCLLMNVDHLYPPPIAAIVRTPCDDVTVFIDTDRALGADDMRVARDGAGHVARIAKTLKTWDAGYVGMTRVPAIALARYLAAADVTRATEGDGAHVERVLQRLADSGTPPACRDVSGHGWLEVDTPEEHARAEATLRAQA